ncbi:MarR family winged helix-turn-helix transcriptional regulator [Curtobacterium sp. VKM Ac-2922]|uniref:MarR family winged helix-turn-helix transcriptional regulator n=1 Tax=Curtobacterium sp. VKM Ac-2922 TaxID=2929475 RepID=UPI001FB2F4AD|nr:MarR family transcriptional regulator [Curtobacterium sp. VKM Ac-2922]MCJ1715805.1 MarR family transcriptional regulator [Curtobacterium sp. VKM Ac-2922]
MDAHTDRGLRDDDETFDELLSAFRQFELAHLRVLRRLLADEGLNETDIRLVLLLSGPDTGGLTPTRVARALDVTTGAVTIMLNRLTPRDIVVSVPNPDDRRSVLVRLGVAGERCRERVRSVYFSVFEDAFPHGDWERIGTRFVRLAAGLDSVSASR